MNFIEKNASRIFWALFTLHIASWTILPTLLLPNAPLDVIEAFAWGREWPLGTYKHPPLAAWLQEIGYHLFGTSGLGYFGLSALSTGGALWAIYRAGRLLAGKAWGLLAAALAQSILYFNFLAVEFNPNVLQLLFWALGGYALSHALIRGKLKYWLLLGVVFGLGLYAKYMMGFLGLVYGAFFLLQPQARRHLAKPGPYLAVAVCGFLFLPHLLWLIHNDFLPFSYAAGRAKPAKDALDWLSFPVLFFLAQLAAMLPALMGAGILILPTQAKAEGPDNLKKSLLFWLAWAPLIILLVLSLIMGRRLEDMWGVPLLNFIPLWLVAAFSVRWDRLHVFLAAWSAIFVLTLALFTCQAVCAPPGKTKPLRALFPGKELSTLIHHEWSEKTSAAPLHYVISGVWLAGNIAFYSPQKEDRPHVWIDAAATTSPWIDPQKVKEAGAVLIWEGASPEWLRGFPNARPQKPFKLEQKAGRKTYPFTLSWAYLPPAPQRVNP